MAEKRIHVWVQRFPDRPNLMLQWLDPDTGKRKSKSAETADEKEAEAKRTDLEADLNAGRYAEASRMSWEGFRELFEEEYLPNCRAGTRTVFRTVFDHFERQCSPKGLRSITGRTVSVFAAALRKLPGRARGTTMAPWTVKVQMNFLRAALNWAAEQKLIPACPAFPSIKVPKKKPQPVALEAVERLLGKADEQARAYLLCGWLAGLRRNEALALEWEQAEDAPWLDFARRRIWLPATFVKAVEDQWVPIDPALAEVLQALPRHGKKVFRFLGRGGRPLTPCSVSWMVTQLARRAGVKLSMKGLRKGFGSALAAQTSAHVLQRLMRHASIQTTLDYYANVDEAVEQAILGRRCNTLRNSQAPAAGEPAGRDGATPEPGQCSE
jgi:integrase